MIRHCEFCGKEIHGSHEKFGQAYFYYCPYCKRHCSTLENLQKQNPNNKLRPLNER